MTRRRHSTCHLHSSSTGVCPSCLHHRLSLLQSPLSSDPDIRHSISHIPPSPHRKSSHAPPRHSLSLLLKADSHLASDRPVNQESEESDVKTTMKEHMDLEFNQPRRRSVSLWTGSGFTNKLQKWKLNKLTKKKPNNGEVEIVIKPTKVMRRRSCDTDMRVSVNVDDPRCSVDEPARASWDGYMIARTIPRLAPMLSVIENAMMNEQMLIEDFETNSISESSSSQRRNSFDCSSSGKSSSKHRAPVEIDHVKSVLPVAKIVVTGAKTGDVGFDLYKDNAKNMEAGLRNTDSFKKKMFKILGFKSKISDPIQVSSVKVQENEVGSFDSYRRSPSIGEIRGPDATFDKNRSVRYSSSPSNFENGLLRFDLTPPLSRDKKPERKSVLGVSRG